MFIITIHKSELLCWPPLRGHGQRATGPAASPGPAAPSCGAATYDACGSFTRLVAGRNGLVAHSTPANPVFRDNQELTEITKTKAEFSLFLSVEIL